MNQPIKAKPRAKRAASSRGSRLKRADVRMLLPYWRALFTAASDRNLGSSALMREMSAAWLEHAYSLLTGKK